MANTKRFSLFIFLAVMVSSSFASFSPSNDYDYQRFLLKRIVSNKAIIESKAEFQNYNEIQVIGGNIIQWDRYNFKFYVPSQLSIRANKTGYLKANNGTLFLTVTKERGGKSVRKLANKSLKKAKIKSTKHTADDSHNIDGLEGWKIIGSGVKKGVGVVYVLMAFKNPVDGNTFVAEIIYYIRNTNDTENYPILINEIIKSFGKIR